MALKSLLVAATALAVAAAAPAALHAAEDFPSETIRIIVPFPPGGAADYMARVVAEAMGEELGSSVVVETRAGASGAIGTDLVAKAEPDGHTLIIGSPATHATNIHLVQNLPYHPLDSFEMIGFVAYAPTIMVATAGLEADSAEEVIAYAKENPGELNYGSGGIGTSQHLSGEVLKVQAGIDIVHVPYRGQDQLIPDLVSGQVHLAFPNINAALGQIQAGALKGMAVSLPERWPALPDVPTFGEAGLPDVEVSSWLILAAPAGTPEDVVAKLESALMSAMARDEVRDRFFDSGNYPVGTDAASARAHVEQQIESWGEIIRLVGLEPQ